MTIIRPKRWHLHWGEPETDSILGVITELSVTAIGRIKRNSKHEAGFINDVLEESEREFIVSTDAERRKSIVIPAEDV